MMPPVPDRPDLMAALHPLAQVPDGPVWNVAELADFFGPGAALVEAAVLVGLVPRNAGTSVLLTRRTDVLRNHAGQVSFPGGRIEPDDADVVAAAVREAGEEIGLLPAQIVPLGYLDPLATITGFRVTPVVATIASDYVARPDSNEVAEVFEVPLSFVLAPSNLVARTVELRGRPRKVLEFVNWEVPAQRIWGVTASILWNLRARLGGEGSQH
jgi:8-oxo-dGTP pyrophosphatase MutT (NUDIX family)